MGKTSRQPDPFARITKLEHLVRRLMVRDLPGSAPAAGGGDLTWTAFDPSWYRSGAFANSSDPPYYAFDQDLFYMQGSIEVPGGSWTDAGTEWLLFSGIAVIPPSIIVDPGSGIPVVPYSTSDFTVGESTTTSVVSGLGIGRVTVSITRNSPGGALSVALPKTWLYDPASDPNAAECTVQLYGTYLRWKYAP